jgi:primary-amine oxidase
MPEGSYVHPLLAADDPPVRRNLYLHCGRFAMMSDGSDTLGVWTARDRPIANHDIVAWYTVGLFCPKA